MSSLLENLLGQLGGKNLKQLSGAIGANEAATQKAVGAALPAILGALSQNAEKGQAEAIFGAIQKDHDGSVLSNITGLIGGQASAKGNGILGHVLGGRRERVERSVAKTAGLDQAAVQKLMPMLAPMVMGAIGKQQREQNLGVAGIASMLQNERKGIEKSGGGGMLAGLLDQDGDGDLDFGDLTKGASKGLLGKLFGK